MANIDAPFGAIVTRHSSGGTSGRLNAYPIASALASNIFEGDWVAMAADGTIDKAAAGSSALVLGIFKSVQYRNVAGEQIYANQWASGQVTLDSADATALINDDPNIYVKMQIDTSVTQAAIGQFADLDTYPSPAGNTATGKSYAALVTGASENQFQITAILAEPARSDSGHGPSTTGAFAIVEVRPFRHQRGPAAVVAEV
jgi:hypothetical protein